MSLARHMVRLLAVMIVTIVAGLGVSAAQAHDGHRPRSGPHLRATAPSASVATVAATMRPAPLRADLRADLRTEAGLPDACALGCPTCTACCHSVLMPAVAGDLPSPTKPVRVAFAQAPMPLGLAPEALPRPPRSFA